MRDYKVWRKEFGALCSTFYRLAILHKGTKDKYFVYDFHTGVNGNCWVETYDYTTIDEDGRAGAGCYHNKWHVYVPSRKLDYREHERERYKDLIGKGYNLIGRYESDIYGRERRIENR